MNKHSIIITVFLVLTGCATTETSKTIPEDHARQDKTVSSKYISGEYECVSLLTSKGTIVLALNKAMAPASVSNFLAYTNASFYNGTIFHRVIDGFMIQGGGFDEKLREKTTGEPIVNEADNQLKNIRGTIAMARTAHPHSASSQFFINTVDNIYLDHTEKTPRGWGYAVFGEVVQGMDVVDSISKAETGPKGIFSQDVPVENIVIKEARSISCKDI